MPIKVLDQKIVSRIAAGEVVERPASVVKELVENALDASASEVSVEVRDGGINLIRVSDNGVGITAGEVELAFSRYATSKIGSLSDLEAISSFGFRGEALPSLAAVAEVDVVTRTATEVGGTNLGLRDGVVVSRGSQGRPQGTTIAVRGLFRRVPARLKFLKSVATENSHIANVVSQYALAFPEIKFTLLIDGRTTLRTPGSSRLLDAIGAVYGLEVARGMLEIEDRGWGSGTNNSPPKITGMIGSPEISRTRRGYLSFFVNRRWINSRLLARAVEEAYHGRLMTDKHPLAVINITLPPTEVDVNVHPTKLEVKFQNERLIYGTVQKAVRQTLIGEMTVPQIEEVATAYGAPAALSPALWPPDTRSSSSQPSPASSTPVASLPVLRILGQFLSCYIVAEGPDGLYLIDQHAAHECLLVEKIKRQRSKQAVEVQGLLEPVTLEVNPRQDEVLRSHYAGLTEFGFSLEPFGARTYLVRAVPALLYQKDWSGALTELLDTFPSGDGGDWEEHIVNSIACHGAVRAGQTLTNDEMRELIRQLEQAESPHTCPHGRPTMICLSSGQLRREFGRS